MRERKIRKFNHVFVSFTAYLLVGLLVIKCSGILDNSIYFIMWGIAAAVILGVRECFHSRVVTVGISSYAALAVLWFGLIADESYRIHAVLSVTGLLGVLFFYRLYCYRTVKVLSGYVMMILLFCLEMMDYSLSSTVIALAVFLFLNAVSETIALSERYSTDTFLFLYVLIAVITVFTPAPQEPYGWGFVVRAVQAVNNIAERALIEIRYRLGQDGSDGMFAYQYTGYSDSSSLLTAEVKKRKTEQLVLDGIRTKRNLYLKGRNSNTFTGERWEMTLEEPTMDCRIDTLETLYAIFEYTQDIEELHRFLEVHGQKVTLSYIRTQSQFYPLKLLGTTVPDMQYVGDNPVSAHIQEKGYSYSYQFVDIDYASKEMEAIIGGGKDISYNEEDYERIYVILQKYYDINLEKIPYADFMEQIADGEERIRNVYGVTDSVVSEQVSELAEDITKDCENDYEKCRALERYLYEYSYYQNITVPEDVNVLDWFLFDGKQGFCVHYATALAEMLRCVGIPSRVAEGFLVDYTDSAMLNQYSIYSSSAHAWVEAYIEGFGWMRLEPTVVNAVNANRTWYALASEEKTQEDMELGQEASGQETSGEELPGQGAAEQTADKMVDIQKDANFWIMLAVWSGGLMILVIIILLALWFYKKHVLKKSNDPDVVFRHLLSLLEKRFLSKENSETLREYFARLSETGQLSAETAASLTEIAEWMERYWYAGIALDDNEIQTMKNVRSQIL